jgi:hypothetical protein
MRNEIRNFSQETSGRPNIDPGFNSNCRSLADKERRDRSFKVKPRNHGLERMEKQNRPGNEEKTESTGRNNGRKSIK